MNPSPKRPRSYRVTVTARPGMILAGSNTPVTRSPRFARREAAAGWGDERMADPAAHSATIESLSLKPEIP